MPTGGKNKWQKVLSSRWFLLVLLVIAIFVAVAYGRAYYRDYQVRQEIERMQNEVKKLEAKKIETMEILKYVKSSNFIEEKARTEMVILDRNRLLQNCGGILEPALQYRNFSGLAEQVRIIRRHGDGVFDALSRLRIEPRFPVDAREKNHRIRPRGPLGAQRVNGQPRFCIAPGMEMLIRCNHAFRRTRAGADKRTQQETA